VYSRPKRNNSVDLVMGLAPGIEMWVIYK